MALLDVQHLSVSFGGVAAIADVSLSLEPGEIHGVIGPNGAGKTSFINAVTGFVPAQSGHIRFGGEDITGASAVTISAKGLGRTFQHGELFGGSSVLDNVLTGLYRHQPYGIAAAVLGVGKAKRLEREARDMAMRILGEFGMAGWADTAARDLPFGLQKRVDMARALAARPRLLLLDEPVSGMSEGEADETVATIKRLARQQSITLLAVEHNMRVLMSLATKVTVLNQGRLLARGTPDEVRKNPEVVQAYLGDGA